MNYLDTSALIKRFVAENGSPLVQTLVTRKGPIATAKIAYAEVYAGLTRKLREGHLSDASYALACRHFEADWQAYIRVELQDDTLFLARDLIRRHPLRGFDAIHLAAAISLKNALGEDITFAAADERLLRAAEAEDLKILHVEIARTP
ncbi:MAG: type II toxin-antitoxin system VapC family toxin [Candidatus Methylomirabilis oxyfera]|nr:type II toxin-antitoxin system VapC family toxin [Candidatus Methylomirabilis oxyfera]